MVLGEWVGLTEQAETLLRVAERVRLAHGGERITIRGQTG